MSQLFDFKGREVYLWNSSPSNVRSVAHRGLSELAPENTIPAYKLAKKYGFYYVECDVAFTSDGIPVLLHDATIDRTSDGSGNISNLTYTQVSSYDFGAWKSSEYAGTKIPTLNEFASVCKNLALHPYVEIKSAATYSESQIQDIVDIMYSYGLRNNVTFISGTQAYLSYVHEYDPKARLGFVNGLGASYDYQQALNICKGLRGTENEVFSDMYIDAVTQTIVDAYMSERIPLEVWTVDSADVVKSINPYISGITSNVLLSDKILYDGEFE